MWPAGGEHPMAMGHGPAASSPSSSTSTRYPAPHSPWQSPVPYLFGGLAAMLGLIALSLLALACSYWKLSGSLLEPDGRDHQPGGTGSRRGDGDGKASSAGEAGPAGDQWREPHVVVIMAGDERPTFLATPAASGWGVDAHDVALSVGCGGAPGEERCVECGAISRPARPGGDQLSPPSDIEHSGGSGSSVISER